MDVATDRMPELTREALGLADRAEPRRAEYTDLPGYYETRATEWLLLVAKLLQRDDVRFDRVLELGCGHGFNLALWRLLGGEVVGIDLPGQVELSKSFLAEHAPDGSITTYATRGEDLEGVEGEFDVIVSQYVLEHVDDIGQVLSAARRHLKTDGYVIHVLNNTVDRLDWHTEYRETVSPVRRLQASLRDRGLKATLRNPAAYTPPHEPKFGDFAAERNGYRLEGWSRRIIREGWAIVDYFASRDINCVLVTRAIDES
jgi:SAM-dependent methyltransferase